MRLKWDKRGLNSLIAKMDGNGFAETVAKKLTPMIDSMREKTFDQEQDVYGQEWKELKKPRIAPKKLAGLKDYIQVSSTGKTIHATSAKDYAGYHQTGTRKMPARQYLPYDNEIPERYKETIKQQVETALKNFFKSSGAKIVP